MFKALLEIEGECRANKTETDRLLPHRWTKPEWIDEFRVWVRKCKLCDTIEIYRANDTILYDPKRGIFVFHDRHEFTSSREEATEMLLKVREHV